MGEKMTNVKHGLVFLIGILLFTGFAVADSPEFSEEFILDTSVTEDVEVSIAVDHPEVDYAFIDNDRKIVFIEDDGTIVDTYDTGTDPNDLSYNAEEEVFVTLDMSGDVRTIEVSSGDASLINSEAVQDAGDVGRSDVVMVEPIDEDTVLILDQEINHELYIYDVTTGSVLDDEDFVDSPPSDGATMVYNWDDEEVWVTERDNTITVFDTSGNSLTEIDDYSIGTGTHYRGYYAHESVYYYDDGDIMKDGSPVLDIDSEHPQDGWHSWSVSLDQEDRFLFPHGDGFDDEGIFLFDDTGLIDEWEDREVTDSHHGGFDTEQFRDMALTGTDDDFQFLFGEGDFDADDKAILGKYGIDQAEPTIDAVSPDDNAQIDPDTQEVGWTVDVDLDGADEVEVNWMLDGGTVLESRNVSSSGEHTYDYDIVGLSDTSLSWNAEVELDGVVEDTTDTRTFIIDSWDIALDNFQPPDSHTIDYDTEEDFSVDVTTPYDADTYISETDENFVYALRFDGDPAPVRDIDFFSEGTISEAVNPMDEGIDVGQNFDFDIEIFLDDDAEITETRTASVGEPTIESSTTSPDEGEQFDWQTDSVTHEVSVTGEGQEINTTISRNGTEIFSVSEEVSGSSTYSTTESVNSGEYYEWEVSATDSWNTATDQSSYSIEEEPDEAQFTDTDIDPDRVKSDDTITLTAELDSPEADVTDVVAEYGSQEITLIEDQGVWTRDHTVPSSEADGDRTVTFTATDEFDRDTTTTDTFEIDNEPPVIDESLTSVIFQPSEDRVRWEIRFEEDWDRLGEMSISLDDPTHSDSTQLDPSVIEEFTGTVEEDKFFYQEDGGDIDVIYWTGVSGESEATGEIDYEDDLGNADSFSESFTIDTVPPELSNFDASNLDHPDSDFYVEGDSIELSIDVTDFSDIDEVTFQNDGLDNGNEIQATLESGDTWTATASVTSDSEALEEQEVDVSATDEYSNSQSEAYPSGLEKADGLMVQSQSVEVAQLDVTHTFQTDIQLDTLNSEIANQDLTLEDYTETELSEGWEYEAQITVVEEAQNYYDTNELQAEDIFGQTVTEDIPEHLVDIEEPDVNPDFLGDDNEESQESVEQDGTITLNPLVEDNVALKEVTVEVDGEEEFREEFQIGDRVGEFSDALDIGDFDSGEIYTVNVTASDHNDNQNYSSWEVWIQPETEEALVDISFDHDYYYRGMTDEDGNDVPNKLTIEMEDSPFDWHESFYGGGNNVRMEMDGTPVQPPESSDIFLFPVSDLPEEPNASRSGHFASNLRETGQVRWYPANVTDDPLGTITYQKIEDGETVDVDENWRWEEREWENGSVFYTYTTDWFTQEQQESAGVNFYDRESYNAEIEMFVEMGENTAVFSESFEMADDVDFRKFRAKSSVEDVTTDIRFRSKLDKENISLNELTISEKESDIDTDALAIQGYEYEYNGTDWILQNETDVLNAPTYEDEPEEGDTEWRFTVSNNAGEDVLMTIPASGEEFTIESDEVSDELVCSRDRGCEEQGAFLDWRTTDAFKDSNLEFQIDGESLIVFQEEDVSLEDKGTGIFSARNIYSTGTIESVERREYDVEMVLEDERTGNIETFEREFKIREDSFNGKFYQFFENSQGWVDWQTGSILFFLTVIVGMVAITSWLGFFAGTVFGVGISLGWLYTGFLPLSVELFIVVLLAGFITLFFRGVKG